MQAVLLGGELVEVLDGKVPVQLSAQSAELPHNLIGNPFLPWKMALVDEPLEAVLFQLPLIMPPDIYRAGYMDLFSVDTFRPYSRRRERGGEISTVRARASRPALRARTAGQRKAALSESCTQGAFCPYRATQKRMLIDCYGIDLCARY